MRKRLALLAFILMLLLSFYGCKYIPFLNKPAESEKVSTTETTDPNFPVSMAGIMIEHKPERVVVLSGEMVERIYDLGLGDIVVGVPDYTIYPEEAQTIINCGTALIPNIEEIENQKTDLVITHAPISQEDTVRLEANGIVVLQLDSPNNLDDLWENYLQLALAIEGGQDGEEIGKDFIGKITGWFGELTSAVGAEEEKSVIYIRRLPFNLATDDSLEGDILKKLNFKNIAGEYTDWLYPKEIAESEEGKALFEGVDLYFFGKPDVTLELLEENDFYKNLPATANDRYLAIDYTAIERHGLRMFEQFEAMVAYAYPEAILPQWDFPRNLEVDDVDDASDEAVINEKSEELADN